MIGRSEREICATFLLGLTLASLVWSGAAVLSSAHIFSNHKGGCGKTTILFHCAGEYAARHSDEKVLVIDSTLRGDLSELLLGGDKQASGKQAVQAVTPFVSTSRLFMLAASASAAHQEHGGARRNTISAKVGKLFGAKDGATPEVMDLAKNVVRCSEFNSKMPDNVYLCPGGSGPQTVYPRQQRIEVADALRKALESSTETWKVFVDSDGDQGFSDYTKIGHALCDRVVIPLKTNVNDFSNRCVPMLEELYNLRVEGEANSRVQLIVWNEVDVQKNAASAVSGLITPSKAAQGVIEMLNSLVAEVASTYPDLFYNAPPEERAQVSEFCGASTMCMRDFGVTGMAASEHGICFCRLKGGKLEGGRLTYDISSESLGSASTNIAELADRLNDAPWGKN
uniref:AAA domain-containing protein n=2 Tax=Hemiselmis andersenii TaxID=464988 RepID=A0A6U5C3U0_HEMAN|mmetsp:Transcript_29418/g.68734  ORF Transcript_29418/g.68734 Transcript_29418/m.68734 type:complete len:397 (+) Transcript_29418:19-1209(+)